VNERRPPLRPLTWIQRLQARLVAMNVRAQRVQERQAPPTVPLSTLSAATRHELRGAVFFQNLNLQGGAMLDGILEIVAYSRVVIERRGTSPERAEFAALLDKLVAGLMAAGVDVGEGKVH
jgi:hypothetical protein